MKSDFYTTVRDKVYVAVGVAAIGAATFGSVPVYGLEGAVNGGSDVRVSSDDGQKSEGVRLGMFDGLEEAIEKRPILSKLPRNANIDVVFYTDKDGEKVMDRGYHIGLEKKGDGEMNIGAQVYMEESRRENEEPDLKIWVPSKYVNSIKSGENLLPLIAGAIKNELKFELGEGKGMLGLLLKYREAVKACMKEKREVRREERRLKSRVGQRTRR